MPSVLHVSMAVKAVVGVMRESEESKFFTSTFVSGVGVGVGAGAGAGSAFLTATPLLHNNYLPDLTQVFLIAA